MESMNKRRFFKLFGAIAPLVWMFKFWRPKPMLGRRVYPNHPKEIQPGWLWTYKGCPADFMAIVTRRAPMEFTHDGHACRNNFGNYFYSRITSNPEKEHLCCSDAANFLFYEPA